MRAATATPSPSPTRHPHPTRSRTSPATRPRACGHRAANTTAPAAEASLKSLVLSDVDTHPAFSPASFEYTADVAGLVAVTTVTATPVDQRAVVSITPDDASPTPGFQVDLIGGTNTITVTVTAEDRTATAAYVVTVTRAANTAPAFAAGPVSRPLAENSPGGTALGAAVTATDADQGQELTYSLHGADGSAFAIDVSSGQISTAAGHDYDFETKSQYQFSVVATDDGSPPMWATAQVTVTLSNVAEVPAVPEPRRSAAARDSITVTWEVPAVGGGPPVSSYDVRYRATGSAVWHDGPQDLSVTRATLGSLDVGTEYEIAVRAANADGDSGWTDPPLRLSTQRSADAMLGALSLSGTVLVPAFAADVLAYAATVPNTTAAVTVTASAADDNATAATAPGAFDTAADGHVVPLSVGANTITVTVTAEDQTATAAYVVTVTRAANTAPGFAAGPVSRPLAENSPGGTALGAAVTATDADQGHKLTYSLHGADGSAFAIDVSSGQISTAAGHDYDFETKSQYQFSVVATDDGSPPMWATAQVTVTLSNVAEVPAVPEPRRSAAARDSITVTWAVPAVGGGPPVSSYDVRYRATGSTGWHDGPQDLTVTRATLGSLDVGTEYEIAVRAANDDGDSGWTDPPLRLSTQRSADAMLGALSLSGTVLVPAFAADVLTYAATVPNTTAAVTVTASAADGHATAATAPEDFDTVADGHQVPLSVGANTITVTVTAEDQTATAAYVVTVTRLPETVAPTLTSARIDGDVLVLSYDEPLDAGSEPAPAAFSVRIADAVTSAARSVPVTGVSIEDDSVQLSLDSAGRHRDTVTVTYQAPASDAIADLAGNQAARLQRAPGSEHDRTRRRSVPQKPRPERCRHPPGILAGLVRVHSRRRGPCRGHHRHRNPGRPARGRVDHAGRRQPNARISSRPHRGHKHHHGHRHRGGPHGHRRLCRDRDACSQYGAGVRCGAGVEAAGGEFAGRHGAGCCGDSHRCRPRPGADLFAARRGRVGVRDRRVQRADQHCVWSRL